MLSRRERSAADEPTSHVACSFGKGLAVALESMDKVWTVEQAQLISRSAVTRHDPARLKSAQ